VLEQELAGGWVNLLSRVHARQEYFQNKDHARKGLISHNTDYLPSDIQAAPAIGTIETIVVLATLAGCENIDILDNFPVARSENLQLSFRDHPLLGLIAIFQQFPGYGAYSM
jgi:hypothetical protein